MGDPTQLAIQCPEYMSDAACEQAPAVKNAFEGVVIPPQEIGNGINYAANSPAAPQAETQPEPMAAQPVANVDVAPTGSSIHSEPTQLDQIAITRDSVRTTEYPCGLLGECVGAMNNLAQDVVQAKEGIQHTANINQPVGDTAVTQDVGQKSVLDTSLNQEDLQYDQLARNNFAPTPGLG